MRLIFLLSVLIFSALSDELIDVKILKSNSWLSFNNIQNYKSQFQKTKLPIKKPHDSNDYWLKIDINKKNLQNKEYLLKVSSTFSVNIIKFKDGIQKSILEENTIRIDNNSPKEIYLKVYNNQDTVYISIELYDVKDFIHQKQFKNKLHGLAYGITLTAFVYYLLFFIYTRKKSSFYYSVTQLFSLLILIFSVDINSLIFDFIYLGFIFFSMLFTREFLNTKKYTPIIDYNGLICQDTLSKNLFPICTCYFKPHF